MEQPGAQVESDTFEDDEEQRLMAQVEALSLESQKQEIARRLQVKDEQDQQEMEMMRTIAQESRREAKKEAVQRKRHRRAEREAIRQSIEDERKRQEIRTQILQQNESQMRTALASSVVESDADARFRLDSEPSLDTTRPRTSAAARSAAIPDPSSNIPSGAFSSAARVQNLRPRRGARPSVRPQNYVTEEQDAAAKAQHATKWQAFPDSWPNNRSFSQQELPGYQTEAPAGHTSVELPREDQ